MKKIEILGLGAGDLDQLPLGVYKKLLAAKHVFLRTKEHPVVAALEAEGFTYASFDAVYEKHQQFAEVYEEIVMKLLQYAQTEEVIYAVPGHPLTAEMTVQMLLERGEKEGVQVEIGGGQSFLDPMFQALKIDPVEGFQLLDGTALKEEDIHPRQHLIIGQVYDRYVASDVKLTLMSRYPDDYPIQVVTAAGSDAEEIKAIPLFELDRQVNISNLTSVYVPPIKDETLLLKTFPKLREIIAVLRSPEGCPWDREQTHESLKKYLIEETFEVIEAIEVGDIDLLVEELGDVLLQVMLHAQIGQDDGYFSIEDIIEGLSAKMIRRHPHVFGEMHVENAEQVVENWENIKKTEKTEGQTSYLAGVSKALPNLLRAYELQKKAAKIGFDWKELSPILAKVREELGEFEEEIRDSSVQSARAQEEFGDLLFSIVNLARFLKIHPEEALFHTNEKFIRRFQYIEERVEESGRAFNDHTLEELDTYWNQAKQKGL